MAEINYKKASMFYFFGNIFNKGITFLTIPIFTRILSTNDYGVISTYNSWVTILSVVLGFALHVSIRSAFIDEKIEMTKYMSVITFFATIVSIGSICLLLVVNYIFALEINIIMFVLCFLQSFATAVIQDYIYLLMMEYNYKFRTALMVLPNFVSVILSVVFIMLFFQTEKYMARIIPTAIITLLFAIFLMIKIFLRSKSVFDVEYLKYALAISAPLILHGVALSLLAQADRTMITVFTDASQTGIYSLVYNFGMLATVITTALEGVWIPWFTEKIKIQQYNDINNVGKKYIDGMMYMIVLLVVVSPELIKLIANQEYWEGIVILPPIIFSNYLIFMYTLYVNVEHYHKKTVYIMVNTVIAATINIVLNLVFIPQFGYVAAAYTTLVSYLISFVLHYLYVRKMEAELLPIKYFAKPMIHIVGSIIVFYGFIDFYIVRWILVSFYILVIFIYERKSLKELKARN